MANRYVDFVPDRVFLDCVNYVCTAYPKIGVAVDLDKLMKNALDPFKMVFDVLNRQSSIDNWIKFESARQDDKNINNKIGEFHQKLLGSVDGWQDLGTGHPLGLDLKNDDDTIFIELKNKHNTVKGDNLKNVFDKLKKVADQHPKAVVYYAYLIPKKPGVVERVWKTSQREADERIIEISGSKVYEIVTGDKDALKKTWEALPKAISEVIKGKMSIKEKFMKKLLEFFNATF